MKNPYYFGQLALAQENHISNLTVRATKETILISISKKNFASLFEGSEPLNLLKIRLLGREVPLQIVLQYKPGFEAFEKVLEKEFACENLRCYIRCHDYRMLEGKVPERFEFDSCKNYETSCKTASYEARKIEGKLIFDHFICENAENQVNISYNVRSAVAKAIEEESYTTGFVLWLHSDDKFLD
jgi:hypothetical protein